MSESFSVPAELEPALTAFKVRVLLVDDQLIIVEAVRRMLSDQPDIEFHYVTDATLAQQTAGQLQPTVILQDLVMPSVDVFFRCVAQHWRGDAVGVLLTGMGRDGAEGLLAMRRAGQTTIAQDQASSAVYGMPRAAAELDAAQLVLPLDKIGPMLRSTTGSRG